MKMYILRHGGDNNLIHITLKVENLKKKQSKLHLNRAEYVLFTIPIAVKYF